MHALTSAFGLHPRHFGKRAEEPAEMPVTVESRSLRSDLRLFAMTFVAGFLFVSVLIA